MVAAHKSGANRGEESGGEEKRGEGTNRSSSRSSSSALFEVLEQTCGTIVVLDFLVFAVGGRREEKEKRRKKKKSRVSAIQRADCLQSHTQTSQHLVSWTRGEPPHTGTFLLEAESKLVSAAEGDYALTWERCVGR